MVPFTPMARQTVRRSGRQGTGVRERILREAFAVFMTHGFTKASTLEIATRARVSKRELYTLVGNKQAMLSAGITERASQMRPPADLPVPHDRAALEQALAAFGGRVLREVTDPTVIGVFRLAIAESERAPEVAHSLHLLARESTRTALMQILGRACANGLLAGDTARMAEQFHGLLWGALMISLLLRVAEPPSAAELQQRAREAAADFLTIHPPGRHSTSRSAMTSG